MICEISSRLLYLFAEQILRRSKNSNNIRKQIVILINNIKLFLFTKKMSGDLDRGRFIGVSEGRLCYILGLDI